MTAAEFVHFHGRRIPSRHVIATGSWKAKQVPSFNPIGMWGTLLAGILELAIDLLPYDNPPILGATLKIVCNLNPAGLINSHFPAGGLDAGRAGTLHAEPRTLA